MHALVTGGAGFIGSHLVDRLLAEGAQVTVVDNFDPYYPRAVKEENIAAHRDHPAYRLVEADIRDLAALRKELAGDYDVIVHLAARAGVRPSIEDPIGYQEVNVGGTQNLLELAREWGVKQFVFGSSSSVYGVNPNVPWREDDHVLLPISPYASSKVSGELMGHVYSHLHGMSVVCLRFFTVYGPRQRPDLAIHKFARLMLAGEAIPVFGDGSSERDYTYVADIVKGIEGAMSYAENHAGCYRVFNLGGSRAVALTELIRLQAEYLGVVPRLRWLPMQPGDVQRTCADVSQARLELGYDTPTTIEEGIPPFLLWLLGQGHADRLILHMALA